MGAAPRRRGCDEGGRGRRTRSQSIGWTGGRLEGGGAGVSAQVAAGVFHQSPALLWLSVRDCGEAVNRSLRQQRNRQVAGGLSWLPNPGLPWPVADSCAQY